MPLNDDGFFAAAPLNFANTHDADGFAQAVAARFGSSSANQLTARLQSPLLPPPASSKSTPMFLSMPATRAPSSSTPSLTSASPLPPSAFTALHPTHLASVVRDPHTLILDIRPHVAYTSARVRSALSLSVPSTLLKRPLFSLSRLAAMLPSSSARRNFKKWKDKSRIVVYDLDSTAVREGSNLLGLMRKFVGEGMPAHAVCWVEGGFQSVWREKRDLIDQDPLPDEPEDEEDDDDDQVLTQPTPPTLTTPGAALAPGITLSLPGAPMLKSKPSNASIPVLRTKHLPMAAFTLSTTTSSRSPGPSARLTATNPISPPSSHPFSFSLASRAAALTTRPSTQAYNPFFDTIRQNLELSHGITERIPLVLPRAVRRRVRKGDLGIKVDGVVGWEWLEAIAWRAGRSGKSGSSSATTDEEDAASKKREEEHDKWNKSREGSTEAIGSDSEEERHGGGGSDQTDLGSDEERHPARKQSSTPSSHSHPSTSSYPSTASSRKSKARYHLPKPTTADVEECAEGLAMQFYKIELAEQRRLMGVMEHHSREGAWVNPAPSGTGSGSSVGGGKSPSSEGSVSPVEARKGIGGSESPPRSDEAFRNEVKARDFAGGFITQLEVRKRYTAGRNRAGSVEGSLGSTGSGSGSVASSGSGGQVPMSSSGSSGRGSGSSSLVGSASASVRDLGLGSTTAVSTSSEEGVQHAKDVAQQQSGGFAREWSFEFGGSGASLGSGSPGGSVSGRERRKRRKVRKDQKQVFPYSITAGVEKGAKNRYRNIWPFEHARVKLHSKPQSFSASTSHRSLSSAASTSSAASGGGLSLSSLGLIREEPKEAGSPGTTNSSISDDYVNASYVQPLGTRKRYIATQGPLEATFADFWTLCWEQNVHVIVMLTKEVEGMMEKSGKYWREGTFGPLTLRLIESSGTPEDEEKSFGYFGAKPKAPATDTEGFFPPVPPEEEVKTKGKDGKERVTTVRRVFELRNIKYPEAGGRVVTQLQYLDWPDLNVPEEPTGVLDLIDMMNKEVERSVEIERKREGEGDGAGRRSHAHGHSHSGSVSSTGSHSSRDSSAEKNELDEKTGIVKRVLESRNPPVLLHCSAGVGRTGGFIVVDAVLDGLKRELRKRREAVARAAMMRDKETGSESAEGMDVDDGEAFTRPVEAGGVLDTPQAGYGRDAPMDVDGQGVRSPSQSVSVGSRAYQSMSPASYPSVSPTPSSSSVSPPLHAGSMSPPTFPFPQVPQPQTLRGFPPKFDIREDSPASSVVSLPRKVSPGGEKAPLVFGGPLEADARVRTHSAPPGPHEVRPAGPTHSRSLDEPHVMASRADVAYPEMMMRNSPEAEAERDESSLRNRSPGMQTTSSASRQSSGHANPTKTSSFDSISSSPSSLFMSHGGRSNTWERNSTPFSSSLSVGAGPADSGRESSEPLKMERERYRPMDTPGTVRNVQVCAQSESPKESGPDFLKSITFDYTQPRRLHQDQSPPLLSSYKDPIRTVVEDIREQRMSLCQSLRQYVFVHRAIIEGALRLVDKEMEVFGGEDLDRGRSDTERHITRKDVAVDTHPIPILVAPTPTAPVHRLGTLQTSPTKHKRLASPTELVKTGTEGQLRLAKRPSVKRRLLSSDESAQFESDAPEAPS